jgi:ATP-dependent DNA helicase PIF1
VLNVASSGITFLLLPGGRTAHSQFAIPLVLVEESCCRIDRESKKVELLAMTSLIIWDEAMMINRMAFEAFDKTMRDIMNTFDKGSFNLPFGGKTTVFRGDFRQILPVVPKGGHADIVHAVINSSLLWRGCKVLKLRKNMQLQNSSNDNDDCSLREFSKWILDTGDGKLGKVRDGEALIQIPDDFCVRSSGNHLVNIVGSTYPNLLESMQDPMFFQDRAILAPSLEIVEKVNDFVIDLMPAEEREYLSYDIVCK